MMASAIKTPKLSETPYLSSPSSAATDHRDDEHEHLESKTGILIGNPQFALNVDGRGNNGDDNSSGGGGSGLFKDALQSNDGFLAGSFAHDTLIGNESAALSNDGGAFSTHIHSDWASDLTTIDPYGTTLISPEFASLFSNGQSGLDQGPDSSSVFAGNDVSHLWDNSNLPTPLSATTTPTTPFSAHSDLGRGGQQQGERKGNGAIHAGRGQEAPWPSPISPHPALFQKYPWQTTAPPRASSHHSNIITSLAPGQFAFDQDRHLNVHQARAQARAQSQETRPTIHIPTTSTSPSQTPLQTASMSSSSLPSKYPSPKSEPTPDHSPGPSPKVPILSPGVVVGTVGGLARGAPKAGTKRKTTHAVAAADDDQDDDDDDDFGGGEGGDHERPVKKTAHNMIEKRYRNNLNDKIAALRDSVPSLRIMSKSARGEDTTEDREELHGLTPAHKLNKATILGKAAEYIRHLEKRITRLSEENTGMQERIRAFEKLLVSTSVPGLQPTGVSFQQQHQQPEHLQFAHTPQQSTSIGPGSVRMRSQQQMPVQRQMQMQQQQQQQQQHSQQHPQQQQAQHNGAWYTPPYFGKAMIGSIAGLMTLEAIRENGSDDADARGLFAIPTQLIRFLYGSIHFHFMGYHFTAQSIVFYLKLFSFLGLCLWVYVPSIFEARPMPRLKAALIVTAPSLASPIHVRRQAWLTAVQTVWVPRHNFVLEAAALILKTFKLSLRNCIGISRYQFLTGLTEEQEAARVKSWSIALDAQLAGGDVEINRSRLTLTLLASKTLPTTPQRLMMQALHIRVLLWDLAPLGPVNVVAAKVARTHWNEARQLHRLLMRIRGNNKPENDDELLPDHLMALVEQECDVVLNDIIIQRAHNLAWNQPTNLEEHLLIDGLNAVVDDTTVRSPLDAVAAWWSCQTVHNALTTSIEAAPDDREAIKAVHDNIGVAIRAAPIGSESQARALVARAVAVSKGRARSIIESLNAINNLELNRTRPVLDADVRYTLAPEIVHELRMSLRSAMALAHLHRLRASATPTAEALQILCSIPIYEQPPMSLLMWSAAYHLTEKLFLHRHNCPVANFHVERLAGGLRLLVRHNPDEKSVFDPELRGALVGRLLELMNEVTGGNHGSRSQGSESEMEHVQRGSQSDSSGWGSDEDEMDEEEEEVDTVVEVGMVQVVPEGVTA